jgi:hypothetical protein
MWGNMQSFSVGPDTRSGAEAIHPCLALSAGRSVPPRLTPSKSPPTHPSSEFLCISSLAVEQREWA